MKPHLHHTALALCVLLLTAGPALAQSGGAADAAVFGSYVQEFIGYWKKKLQDQNSIILGVIGLGVVSILIIVTSKKGK